MPWPALPTLSTDAGNSAVCSPLATSPATVPVCVPFSPSRQAPGTPEGGGWRRACFPVNPCACELGWGRQLLYLWCPWQDSNLQPAA